MSAQPPSYTPTAKAGPYPPQQAGYPPPQAGYPPPQAGYPPQQAGYPPQQAGQPLQPVLAQPQVQTTTVVTSFGNYPVRVNCTNCRTEQMTVIRRKIGAMNWVVCGIVALVMFILGFELLIPFLLIPFAFIALCIPSLMDVEHVCPNCNHVNGIHRAM